jgi:hypothetical protein
MKVFLDDLRTTPIDWVRVYWPDEAIELLKTGKVTEITLDHDLGDDERGTGREVTNWIEEQVYLHDFNPPVIYIHSDNSCGQKTMLGAIKNINLKIGRHQSVYFLKAFYKD